jgi:hypothetical protein
MAKTPSKEDFLESLEADAEIYFDGGRQSNIVDICFTVGAILTSLIAASVAATDVDRWIRVGVAAVPAGFTSIQKVYERYSSFKLNGRDKFS